MKRIFCLVLLAALILCGCSSKKEPAAQLKTVTVGISQDLDKSLDPHVSTSAGKREILYNIFEGLLKADTEGNLVPALAESYGSSEDGKVFTFKLRKGVKFHNGKEMSAADVLYSLNRCKDENLVSAFDVIESIESPDADTVVITLKETSLEFLASLTTAILPADYEKQETAPVGTGPYKFESRSVQENLIFVRNEDYWGEKASIDKIVFQIIENTESMIMALRSGSIDLCVHRLAEEVKDLGDTFNIIPTSTNMVQALYLNNAVKPLDDLRVRQALNYAVDVRALLDLTADGMGTPVGSSMFPAFGKYYLPELSDAYPYDAEKAKALLADAGYPNGFDLTITVPSNYLAHVNTAQILADQLKKIGVNVKINQIEWASWLSDVYRGRNFESTVIGFDASTLTARAMLDRFVSTSSKNMINFNNAEYDAVMAEAASCPDDAKQVELYKRAETILSEEAANVYLQDPAEFVVISKKLDGYTLYPMFVMDMAAIHFVEN